MNDVIEQVIALIEGLNITGLSVDDGRIVEEKSRDYPRCIVKIVPTGHIDRMFRTGVSTFNPKFEQYRVQIDVVNHWNDNSALTRKIWQDIQDALEDSDLAVSTSTTYGPGSIRTDFIAVRREGLPHEEIEENVIIVQGDWLVEIQRSKV